MRQDVMLNRARDMNSALVLVLLTLEAIWPLTNNLPYEPITNMYLKPLFSGMSFPIRKCSWGEAREKSFTKY